MKYQNADKWRSEASNLQLVQSGINITNEYMHKLWVDDITTIKGTDSITVNVGKDLNLTGAAILSDNLALAVKGNINKKDLNDSYYSESMGIGFSQNLTTNGNQATIPGTGGKPNQAPGGSTSINANYSQNESSRSVYATIGGLNSTLTSATKDVTGGDFEGSLTLDHRLFSEAGRNQIGKELKQSIEVGKIVLPKIWASPNTALGLTLGGVGYLYGAATGKDVKVSIGNNAVQFEGNPLGQDGAAITLGNTISYFGSARAEDIHPVYEANNIFYEPNLNNTVILGKHEQEHTYQYEKLGPLFLPIYSLYGIADPKNPFEQAADKAGNQFYRKAYENRQ